MNHFTYDAKGTCTQLIEFDTDGSVLTNLVFHGGCNGNLKAISKLVEGKELTEVASILEGNICGDKPTSCADQLSKACTAAYEQYHS